MNKKEDTNTQEGGEDVEEEEESREEIIAQLKATKQLDVSRQELTVKKLPPELGLMVNLEMLSMSNNELADLPKSFGRFLWFLKLIFPFLSSFL
jgi:Leucine-rich repeat (LRR) protein